MRKVVLFLLSFVIHFHLLGQDYLSHSNNYRLYRHFWFGREIETDRILARQVINDRNAFYEENRESWFLFDRCRTANGFDEFVKSDSINKVIPSQVHEDDVISRFMLSLEVYNLWFKFKKKRGTVDKVDIDLFFEGPMKRHYHGDWIENGINYGSIILKNAGSISEYNFGHNVYPVFKKNHCSVYFPPSKAQLKCSKKLFEDLLFPKYLNYISKEHRLTNYQLGIEKVGFSPDESINKEENE